MAGQLQSAIAEIQNVYELFMSLKNINQNQSPACVIECLEKFFGNGNLNRLMFTSGDETQMRVMKNLQTVYKVYQKLAIWCPDSAPNTLIEALDAILKSSNLETENSNGDNNDEKSQDNDDDDSPSVFDGALVRNEEVRETLPSTSSFHNQLQQRRVKIWVDTNSSPSPASSNNQDEINDVENTANSENVQQNADEIVSNGDSSSSSGLSTLFNQNRQQNDNGIQGTPENKKVYACSYACGKTFGTQAGRYSHEKFHSGIGLVNCHYCDRQFATRQNCANHQIICPKLPPAMRQQRRQRIPFPHTCEFCHKKFANAQILERHRRTYSGERVKKCRFPSCPRGFCYESHRLLHEKTHSKS